MKIYITGSTGRLGKAVLKTIPDAIPVNLRDENLDLKKKFADATHVIHLAGSLRFDNKQELWKGNFQLTKRVVAALPSKARIIYASSISVYGKHLAEIPANERTVCHQDSQYANSKYAAELQVRMHPDHVALRISAIYGTDFEDYFKMIDILCKGKMFLVGEGDNHVPFVHVQDVAAVIKNALDAKVPAGVYLLSSDPITQKKIYQVTCKELGIPVPKRKLNKHFAAILLSATGFIRKFLGKGEFLTMEHLNILGNNRVFDCSKAKKYLKFRPRTIESGIKELVKTYKKKGWYETAKNKNIENL